MLRSTFLHLPGVGWATEAQLWRAGVRDWAELRQLAELPGVPADRRAAIDRTLDESEEALRARNADWFCRRLPLAERWRLFPEFRDLTAFLDIETTALSPQEGIVTVVGVHGGGATRAFIAYDDLEELPAYLQKFRLIVTFNGILFDLPFLEARFPYIRFPPAHIDLRFLLRRLGITGGLKRIEKELGLGDRSGVEGIEGAAAVRLWEDARRGVPGALTKLVDYNRADCVNLEPLLDFAVREMSHRLLPPAPIPSAK
ncbi:MAG: ribonuclease H-like domain-containing protein [Thermoplasmata archaeon]